MSDECHLVWGDTCGYVWGKTQERIEVPMTNERERQTYYGALDYFSLDLPISALGQREIREYIPLSIQNHKSG